MVETQTERKVKILRTDNGMEFCSNEFDKFYSNDGMVRHHTIPYTPQQTTTKRLTSDGSFRLTSDGQTACHWYTVTGNRLLVTGNLRPSLVIRYH
jgi:hypothetical protein